MTIAEIKKQMTDNFIANETVKEKYNLRDGKNFEEQFSVVSVESILFYIVATAVWLMCRLFDRHKSEIEQMLKEQTSGTANWYAYKAKLFRFGMNLVPETDYYDNTGLTEEQVETARIVKYAAAVESRDKSILYLKIATGTDAVRQPLLPAQLTAFKQYINEIQYAGVRISIINDPADQIRLIIDIYYDPLVLDSEGKRLDGTSETPVQNTIRNYLNNLPFNGTYANQSLVDVLQQTPGVDTAEIKSASSRYGAYAEWTEINAREIAHSGYYAVSNDNLILNFIPNEEIL
jgi:hypothetical protein